MGSHAQYKKTKKKSYTIWYLDRQARPQNLAQARMQDDQQWVQSQPLVLSLLAGKGPPLSTAVRKDHSFWWTGELRGGQQKHISSTSHSKSSLTERCLVPFWKECSSPSCSLPGVKYDRNEVLLIVTEKDSYCLWPVLGSRKAKFVSQGTAGASKLSPRLTNLCVTSAPPAILSALFGGNWYYNYWSQQGPNMQAEVFLAFGAMRAGGLGLQTPVGSTPCSQIALLEFHPHPRILCRQVTEQCPALGLCEGKLFLPKLAASY